MSSPRNNEGLPASVEHQQALRKLISDVGEEEAAKQIGIGRSTLPRILGGMGVRFGTRLALGHRFDKAPKP